jgi:hypothetical protein
MEEKDPYGHEAKEPGAKFDRDKCPIVAGCLQYFPRALLQIANVSLIGAKKYSWKGWEKVPNGIQRYTEALGRHLLAESLDEAGIDSDTNVLHACLVAWNSLARLELILRGKEKNAIPEKD